MIAYVDQVPDGYEKLAEQAMLVRWVGKRDVKSGELFTVYPQFIVPGALTAPRAGVVLLTQLARSLTLEPKLAYASFSVGNLDDLDRHLGLSFGQATQEHLIRTFTGAKLGHDNAQFLARQVAAVLRFNHPAVASRVVIDKTRIHRERPFKQLTKFSADRRCTTLASLAYLVGTHYVEAQQRL